jgi:type II secretory pathway component GspD/PulD (secretin)
MNNKVAPVQVTTSENYVKETSVTTSGSGDDRDTEVDMETDTLNYGFSMEILPRILDHGRLIILFSLTISDLISLEQFSSNSGTMNGKSEDSEEEDTNSGDSETTIVQLPKMQMRGFMQEIAMRSGSTLVLTGFEKVSDTTKSAGIGKPKMSLLGGQAYNNNTRDVLVILLTPEVLESPMSPETRMRDF